MIQLGHMNSLPVLRLEPRGAWLDAGDFGERLLPRRQLPEGIQVGQSVSVFAYLDADNELELTAFKPHAQVGEFAGLKVVAANRIGAFLDWGLKKDLFVPSREQAQPMQVGKTYVVFLYLDSEGRVAATSRLDHYLSQAIPPYPVGQEVSLLVAQQTDLGYKVIVDNQFWGLLFRSDVFGRLQVGRPAKGFVKRVREDGKLDISLNRPGVAGTDDAAERILARLRKQQGFLPLGDRSSPELIYAQLAMSKGTFKKAIGGLLKRGLISLEEQGIRLTPEARE